MKHFVIDITYRVPVDQLGEVRARHRQYLREHGYDRGLLLFSGPKVPPTGGLEVARAASPADIDDFMAHDPFILEGVADYQITEFDPVLRQDWMVDWITGTKA